MRKEKVFIINGAAGSGKTTFENICKDYLNSQDMELLITSIINPVKFLVINADIWDGKTKDSKTRKFLSDLKDLLSNYCDFPMIKLQEEIFSNNPDVTMIDMREPEDINNFKALYKEKYDIKTVLIRRLGDTETANAANNHADKEIFNYNYDLTIFNYSNLDELKNTAKIFIDTFILENPLSEEYYQRFSYE